MDFLERLFGISTDGGNGTTELSYILAIVGVALIVYGSRYFGRLLNGRDWS